MPRAPRIGATNPFSPLGYSEVLQVNHSLMRSTPRLLRWLRSQIIPLPTADSIVSERLEPLLRNKRVAFLGELLHFIEEKYTFREQLIRWLLPKGFAVVGEELPASDGRRLQQYWRGDRRTLAELSLLGYRGDERTDRNDRPTGLLKPFFDDAYPKTGLRRAQTAFYERLAACRDGAGKPLEAFGFDTDGICGGTYQDLYQLLQPLPPHRIGDAFKRMLQRVPNETIDGEIERIDWLRDWTELQSAPLIDLLGANSFDEVTFQLLQLRDTLDYVRHAYPAQEWPQLAEGMALREAQMQRNVARVLSETHPQGKAILMAASAHLSKDDSDLRPPHGPGGPGGGRVNSLGHFIAQMLCPQQVFAVWMIHGGGKDGQPWDLKQQSVRVARGSLNALLAKVSDRPFFLPLDNLDHPDAAPLRDPVVITQMYNLSFTCHLQQQVDALWFEPKVTALAP